MANINEQLAAKWPLEQLTALAPRHGAMEEDDQALAPFFAYHDRESYLAWVAEWKELYRGLSVDIRTDKRAIWKADKDATWQQRHALVQQRRLARAMLALRHAAKRDSWRRATAERAAAEVA